MSHFVKYYDRKNKTISKKNLLINYFIYFFLIPFLTYLVGVKDYNVWVDYPTYWNYFEMAISNNFSDIFMLGKDPLFVMLNKPFTEVSDGFQYFLVTIAVITLIIKFSALKNSTDNPLVLFILYFSFLLCLHDYIQIRVSLAIAISAWAIYITKNKKKSILLFAIAASIHLSVLFIIIFYLIYLYASKRVLKMAIISSFVFPAILFSGLIHNARVDTYIALASNKEQYYQINVFATQPILQALSVLIIFFSSRLKDYKWSYEFSISIVGVLVFYSFSGVPVFAFRFFELTMFFNIILLSKCYNNSLLIKGVCLLYILVGIKNMFYGASALIWPIL